jgi:hypothetical protein
MLLPLHQRGNDSVAEFEAAARLRYSEREELHKRSRHLGGIYLFGYSVEMRVKACFFRNAGFPVRRIITHADRQAAVAMATTLGLPTPPGPHDVAGWAALSVAARLTTTAPYVPALATEMIARATALYLIWRETLRYRAVQPTSGEITTVRSAARWFDRNHAKMR